MNEPSGSTTSKIRDALYYCYNDDELRVLCMDLEIDYENLEGGTRQIKVMELIGYLQRRGRIQDLINVCSRQRLHVNWNELLKAPSSTGQVSAQLIEEKSISDNVRRAAIGVAIATVVIAIALSGICIYTRWQQSLDSSIPLEIVQRFDFEESGDPTNINPWVAVPKSKSHTVLISDNGTARSGKGALQLKVNLLAVNSAPNEHAGVATYNYKWNKLDSHLIRLIVAWIYLPPSEQVQNSHILSHAMAYTLDHNGNSIGLYSEEVELETGKWIPITLGLTYNGYTKDASLDSKDRRILEFYLTIWSDQPYVGSIYIDDITFYTGITNAR